nr:MAG TPA: hypothetical protein [Caudoviricetes sp.]
MLSNNIIEHRELITILILFLFLELVCNINCVLLFNPPDETLLSSYFCSSIFLENTGFFETRER